MEILDGDVLMEQMALATIFVTQSMLIAALIIQSGRRRQAEISLRQREAKTALAMLDAIVDSTFAMTRESEAALRTKNAEIQNLAGRLIASQEAERRRIGRDLHDNVSQKIALLMVDVDRLRLTGGPTPITVAAQEISRRAREIATDIHQLSYQLHPSKLETLGLVRATAGMCQDIAAQHHIVADFRHQNVPDRVPPEVALCLYRIVQEGLRNVVKHSGAKRASVELIGAGGELRLDIADQGSGFDTKDTTRAGLGLISIRERVNFLGGEILVQSAPGRGTRIGVRVPLMDDARPGVVPKRRSTYPLQPFDEAIVAGAKALQSV